VKKYDQGTHPWASEAFFTMKLTAKYPSPSDDNEYIKTSENTCNSNNKADPKTLRHKSK